MIQTCKDVDCDCVEMMSLKEAQARVHQLVKENARLRERLDGQTEHSVVLSRIIEDLCHDRPIRHTTEAPHHYEMAVEYMWSRNKHSNEVALAQGENDENG